MKIVPVISPVNGYVVDINYNEIIIKLDKDSNYKDFNVPNYVKITSNKDSLIVLFNNSYHINAVTKGSKLLSGKNVIAFLIILEDTNQYIKIDQAFNTLSDEEKIEIVKIFILDQEFKHLKQLILITSSKRCEYIDLPEHNKCDNYSQLLAKSLNDHIDAKDKDILFLQENQKSEEGNFTNLRNSIRRKIFNQINKIMDSKVFTEKNIIYLIQCNSFFNSTNFDTLRIKNPDVVVKFPKVQQLDIIEELIELFKEENIVGVKQFAYKPEDKIQEYANFDQIYDEKIILIPILIEINEILSIEKINRISKVINKWIPAINQYYLKKI